MIDPHDLRQYIIDPVLQAIGLYSTAASNLVLGTGIIESNLAYLHQRGGPALGLFQMEPDTHDDLVKTFLPSRPKVAAMLQGYKYSSGWIHPLMGSLPYAAAMTRIFYLRVPDPLPNASDAHGLALYWKTFYNTALGAGTVSGALGAFQEAIQT